jgi:hypothetical protein
MDEEVFRSSSNQPVLTPDEAAAGAIALLAGKAILPDCSFQKKPFPKKERSDAKA